MRDVSLMQIPSLDTFIDVLLIMQTGSDVTFPKFDLLNSCAKFRVLVGVTGSVAALKLSPLVSQLLELPGVSGSPLQ